MAELVKEENSLVALKVYLDYSRPSAPATVVFEVDRGSAPLETFTATGSELGIPDDFDAAAYRYDEPAFAMPSSLTERLLGPIEHALAERGEAEPILWLHLASPAGFLPLLPWERMLRQAFATPVIRVPNFALFPSFEPDVVDIVLCASQPRAKSAFSASRYLLEMADSLIESIPNQVAIHVFADAPTTQDLRASGGQSIGERPGGSLEVYDPAEAGVPDVARMTSGTSPGDDPVSSPWLIWIMKAMRGRTVDAVHFLTHAYVYADQPSLAVAESPLTNTDRVWSRFIGPAELSSFLGAIGAWAVGASSPPHGYSPMATRLLGERLAHMRAGPIILHDFQDDPEGRDLIAAYSGLLQRKRPSQSSGIGMYCHPRVFSEIGPGDSMPYAERLVADSIGLTRTPQQTPPWVVLATRSLEQTAAQLFPDQEEPASEVERAAGEGVKAALSFLHGVLENVGEASYLEAAPAQAASSEEPAESGHEAMA